MSVEQPVPLGAEAVAPRRFDDPRAEPAWVRWLLIGAALAFLLGDSPRRYAMAIGLAYGFALYSVVFHGLASKYPWLASYRTIDTLVAHVLYGALLARAYCALRQE